MDNACNMKILGSTGLGGKFPYPELTIITVKNDSYDISFIETGVYNLRKNMNIPLLKSTVIGNSTDILPSYGNKFFVLSRCPIAWSKIIETNALIQLNQTHNKKLADARVYI